MIKKYKFTKILLSVLLLAVMVAPSVAYAATYTCGDPNGKPPPTTISIDIGCSHRGTPLADAIFAIIRVLSTGVGLIVVGSLVVAGIQYTTSKGDPNATAKAIGRIRSTVVALFIYIFGFAILNYVIPAGFFK